jgi:hypothetical protein
MKPNPYAKADGWYWYDDDGNENGPYPSAFCADKVKQAYMYDWLIDGYEIPWKELRATYPDCFTLLAQPASSSGPS